MDIFDYNPRINDLDLKIHQNSFLYMCSLVEELKKITNVKCVIVKNDIEELSKVRAKSENWKLLGPSFNSDIGELKEGVSIYGLDESEQIITVIAARFVYLRRYQTLKSSIETNEFHFKNPSKIKGEKAECYADIATTIKGCGVVDLGALWVHPSQRGTKGNVAKILTTLIKLVAVRTWVSFDWFVGTTLMKNTGGLIFDHQGFCNASHGLMWKSKTSPELNGIVFTLSTVTKSQFTQEILHAV